MAWGVDPEFKTRYHQKKRYILYIFLLFHSIPVLISSVITAHIVLSLLLYSARLLELRWWWVLTSYYYIFNSRCVYQLWLLHSKLSLWVVAGDQPWVHWANTDCYVMPSGQWLQPSPTCTVRILHRNYSRK
jgi:hypothetical protein